MHKLSGRSGERGITRSVTALALVAALVSCGGGDNSSGQAGGGEVVLPVSINEIKVSLVNKVSDPYWTGTWNVPRNEQDWRELEHLAYQVELGGALLKFPGTGVMDKTWTSNADWQQLAEQLSQDGARAVNAVRSRNRELMDRAGSQLIETCEACHRAFQPDLPTLDRYGSQVALPPVSL
ncbi:MAG: cytochrome c [Pseudohongiella sp.]|nr:cytochrome c [Pseudohongiella sp.]MDP2128290.1 cytochrome c [Pseudohongiella sp.]